jgi:hypothetical protein
VPTLTSLTIFLASPSDLAEERRTTKIVVDDLNRHLGRQLGVHIELVGWEDTLPGVGRPQALINKEVDSCDLFLGLLWQRWGSPSGEYSSGFEEEFELARRRRRETGVPEIWLFFKDIESGRSADPGEQLRKVMAFRDRLVAERELLFRPFPNTQSWERHLRNALTEYLAELYARNAAIETVSAQGTVPPATPEAASSEELPTERPAYQQVVQAAKMLAESAGDLDHPLDSIGLQNAIRLYLLAAALLYSRGVSTEPLGVHQINATYKHRDEVLPTGDESMMILRTLLEDRHDVVPGWYWFADLSKESLANILLGRAFVDTNEEVRLGALECLSTLGIVPSVPTSEWPSDSLLGDESVRVRRAVATLLGTLADNGDAEALEGLRLLEGDSDRGVRGEAIKARLRSVARGDVARAFAESLALPGDVLENVNELIEPWLGKVASAALVAALGHPDVNMRRLVSRELLNRGALTEELAERVKEDSSPRVREIGYRALARAGVRLDPAVVRKSVANEQPPSLLGFDPDHVDADELVFETYGVWTFEELVEELD